jgi:glycerol-3-phosphate dehydrogenase
MARLAEPRTYDVAIIGGGATGLGVALDAAARGLSVVLVESHDFAKGTSSRSTKLLHGGVRYLAQGNIVLVREALHERSTVLANAPHLAQPLPFVMPSYAWWQTPFYGLGLKAYDLLAGRARLGVTEFLSRARAQSCLPNLKSGGLKGCVKHWDAQFDDARLALALARTAANHGALLINYCAARSLTHENGKVVGLHCEDSLTGESYSVRAACVINAAGVWVDELRQQDGVVMGRLVRPMVAPSQGVHIVVERDFMPGDHALLVPHTSDGRVLFAVPWLGKLILGTTDTPRADLSREPRPFHQEIEFILGESARYLARPPTRADIKSVWVGLRPLVKPRAEEGESTQSLSREHTVLVSRSGLVTVTGGKWTTYRAMAEDVLEHCFKANLLPRSAKGVTTHLKLLGGGRTPASHPGISAKPGIHLYGDEAPAVLALPGSDDELGGGLTQAMVRFSAQCEYAHTVEDVLARRSRLLFLDARLAASLATRVGEILRQETGLDPKIAEFLGLAQAYLTVPE